MRQQQQIEINQQLLHAKEKRLRTLKLEESKQAHVLAVQQQGHKETAGGTAASAAATHKMESLRQSVLSQELKIFKLKQLRNQIVEYKLSNANMYSELDVIKSLFEQKERDLYSAASRVTELNKQVEQLRKLKHKNSNVNQADQQQVFNYTKKKENNLCPSIS